MHELADLLKKKVVHDLAAAEYHASPALGSSTVRALLSSTPAHALHKLQHGEQTEAQALGTAVHCSVLTPQLYSAEIAIAPECDRRTTVGKETYAKFVASIGNRSTSSIIPELHCCRPDFTAYLCLYRFACGLQSFQITVQSYDVSLQHVSTS